MLFNGKIKEIQNQVNTNALEIEALLLRVEELRSQNLALENHLQQLGSAESAAESAIEQIKTALLMINAISPAEVVTFKSAIDGLFGEVSVQTILPAGDDEVDDDEPTAPIAPDDAPNSLKDLIIDIASDLYPDSEHSGNGSEHSEPSSEDVQNFASEDVAREELRAKLYSVGINGLRKLAKKRGLTATGTTAILVNRMIQDGVTIEDLK